MKITLIGKKGCTKCSKMELILKGRGYQTYLVYPDSLGRKDIDGVEVNLTEETHFPLYIVDHRMVENFKDLNQMLVHQEMMPNPRAEEP